MTTAVSNAGGPRRTFGTSGADPPKYKRRPAQPVGMATAHEEVLDRVGSVLSGHPVTFAMLFGSVARGEGAETSDLDLAVEFDERVREDGYSDAYLSLLTDLETALDVDVDVVTVASMPPRFAHVAFEEGVVVLGTEARKDALARDLAGEPPSTADARERVTAAAARLTDHDP